MNLLESVFKHLVKENNRIIIQVEQNEGVEKLTQLLSDSDLNPDTDRIVI